MHLNGVRGGGNEAPYDDFLFWSSHAKAHSCLYLFPTGLFSVHACLGIVGHHVSKNW